MEPHIFQQEGFDFKPLSQWCNVLISFSFPLFTRSIYFYKNTTTMSPLTQEKVSLEIIGQKNFYKK